MWGIVPELATDHSELRQMVADYLARREHVFTIFLPKGSGQPRFRGFKQYLEYVASPRKWGDNVTLAALAAGGQSEEANYCRQ